MARFSVASRIIFVCFATAAAPAAAQTMCSPNALFTVGNKLGMAVADIYRSPSDNAKPSYLREARSKLMSAKTGLRRAGIATQDKAIDAAMKQIDAFSAKVTPANLITVQSAGQLGRDVERTLAPVRSEVGRFCPR